jgi:hypothetical protein
VVTKTVARFGAEGAPAGRGEGVENGEMEFAVNKEVVLIRGESVAGEVTRE